MSNEWINSFDALPDGDAIVLAVFETKTINRLNGKEVRHTAYVAQTKHNNNEIWGGWQCCRMRQHDFYHRIPYWMPMPELPKDLLKYKISDNELINPDE